jgi:hypothetical protein
MKKSAGEYSLNSSFTHPRIVMLDTTTKVGKSKQALAGQMNIAAELALVLQQNRSDYLWWQFRRRSLVSWGSEDHSFPDSEVIFRR